MRRFGIDLGTTNTCIYRATYFTGDEDSFDLDSIDILYQEKGDIINPRMEKRMRSAIYARPNREVPGSYIYYVGDIAIRMANLDNAVEIINTKRLLCQEQPDTIIAYGLTAQQIATKLLEVCYYSITRNTSENQLNNSKFCITQPAAFGLFAGRAIKDAALQAGIRNPESFREPTAALLSYLFDQLKDPEQAGRLISNQENHGDRLLTLVVDIGGGTTDVTIQEIRISGTREAGPNDDACTGYKISFLNQIKDEEEDEQEGKNKPVATANQEPAFGGFDFDKVIVTNVVSKWNAQYYEKYEKDYDWDSPEAYQQIFRLYDEVKMYKESLSNIPEYADQTHEFTFTTNSGDILTCTTTPEQIYEWTKDLCEPKDDYDVGGRTVYDIIADTIWRSGYKLEDIDCMFVTGGMSSYKPIRQMLKRRFPELDANGVLQFSDTPLEDIARGAAVYNSFFTVDSPLTTLFSDVMIDDPCGPPRVLVRRNSPLPAEGVEENFMSIRNPAYLYVDVLSGFGPYDYRLKRLRRLRYELPRIFNPAESNISVKWRIDEHSDIEMELIVRGPSGECTVSLLEPLNI